MKYKIFLVSVLLLVLSAQAVFTQNEKVADNEDGLIRSKVLRVNKLLSTFKKSTKLVDGISTEGAEVNVYRSQRAIQKIETHIAGETYNTKVDYYYNIAGKLIFAYYRFNRYDTHISMNPPPKVVKTEEKRIYFKNGNIFKKITTITETKLNDTSALDDKEIIDLEKTFRKAIGN